MEGRRLAGKVAYPIELKNEEIMSKLEKVIKLNISENEKKLLWKYIEHNLRSKESIIAQLKIITETEEWNNNIDNLPNLVYDFKNFTVEEKKQIAKDLLTKIENNEIDIW